VPRNDTPSVIASVAWQSQEKQNSKVKDQDEEGFYLLICHFDFLCLIFDIVRNLELQPGDCFVAAAPRNDKGGSLRAEGVAIPVGREIALALTCLAMTKVESASQ
jgi:hypothetical protein